MRCATIFLTCFFVPVQQIFAFKKAKIKKEKGKGNSRGDSGVIVFIVIIILSFGIVADFR